MVVEKESIELDVAIQVLEGKVKQLLSDGWKPQGGISVAISPRSEYHHEEYYVAQAMVKED